MLPEVKHETTINLIQQIKFINSKFKKKEIKVKEISYNRRGIDLFETIYSNGFYIKLNACFGEINMPCDYISIRYENEIIVSYDCNNDLLGYLPPLHKELKIYVEDVKSIEFVKPMVIERK